MNRYPRRRFTKGLSSGFFILSFFTVGYLVDGETGRAIASDDRSKPAKQEAPTNAPGATDASPSQKNSDDSKPAPESPSTEKQLNLDESKAAPADSNNDAKEDALQDFHATAYSLKGLTASGEPVRQGVIAADPRVLPLGTVVHIKAGRYTGTYTVLDTGSRVKGRKVDIYMPTYKEAKRFGRQRVKVRVISRKK